MIVLWSSLNECGRNGTLCLSDMHIIWQPVFRAWPLFVEHQFLFEELQNSSNPSYPGIIHLRWIIYQIVPDWSLTNRKLLHGYSFVLCVAFDAIRASSWSMCEEKDNNTPVLRSCCLWWLLVVLADLSGAQMQLQPEEGAVFESDSRQKCLLC